MVLGESFQFGNKFFLHGKLFFHNFITDFFSYYLGMFSGVSNKNVDKVT